MNEETMPTEQKEAKQEETNTQRNLRHDKHQVMLQEHLAQKEARNSRRVEGNHKLYKQESEMLGFNPISVPTNRQCLVFSTPVEEPVTVTTLI